MTEYAFGIKPSPLDMANDDARAQIDYEAIQRGETFKGLTEEFKGAAGLTEKGSIPTASILGAAVSPIMGMLPPGRTFSRIGGQLLGNVLSHAGAEVGGEAIDKPAGEREMGSAAIRGGIKGVLPGLIQGGMGAIFGPSKGTIQAQKAIQSVKQAVSPQVGAVLDATNPASFFKRGTPKAMERAAGTNLDAVEAAISKRLKGQKFTEEMALPGGKKLRSEPTTTFEQLRAQIKDLRKDAGPLAYAQDPVTQKTARESLAKAAWIEQNMLKQMPPEIAQAYQLAMRQHAKDMDAVRFVKGKQQQGKISGGVNPYDNPKLATAERQLSPIKPSALAHGAVGAVEAATGRGLGASYHVSRALDAIKSKGVGKVAEKIPSKLKGRLPGVVAGTATSAAQDYAQGSVQDYMTRSTE